MTWTIASTFADTAIVDKEIIEVMQKFGYCREAVFSVRLALDERLVNAVNHGKEDDPAKTIQIDFEIDEQRLVIEVQGQNPVIFPN